MRFLPLERLLAPPDPRGVARDPSGRALARASYLLLLASSGGLVATERGEGWLALALAITCAAGLLDRWKRSRPSLATLGVVAGAVLAAIWARELWDLASHSLRMNELLGTVAESVWIGGALLALLDKNWTHLCGLVLCALVVGFLGLAGAQNAAILWALLAIAWCLLLVLQRAQRWRSAALLGREDGGGIGLDHGARRGALPAIAQGVLASWFLCASAVLAILCYLVTPKSVLRARDGDAVDPGRSEWGRLAGFSEGLSLGGLGDLKQNFEPALIVRPLAPDGGALMRALARRPLFWRGLAHARYEAAEHRWRAEDPLVVAPCMAIEDSAAQADEARGSAPRAPRAQWEAGEPALAYEQELLLGESRVVFALDPAHSVDFELRYPRRRSLEGSLRRDGEGALWCIDESGRGVLREGALLVARAARAVRDRRASRPRVHSDARYAELEPRLVRDPRFQRATQRFGEALQAARIAGGAFTIEALEKAIAEALHKHCRYSLQLLGGARNVPEPLLSFLEGSEAERQGHCLFFATAAALLLRDHGMSTRLVSGFSGGVERDGRWIIAAAHAHAWIEVWCGEKGWIAVDATPPAHRPEGESRERVAQRAAARIEAAADERAYAAERDDGGQPLFTAARRFVEDFSASDPMVRERAEDRLRAAAAEWGRDLANGAVDAAPVLLLGVGAGVAAMLALRFARRQRRTRAHPRKGLSAAALAGARLYDRCLALLARTGLVRTPNETPREFEARAAAHTSEAISELLFEQTRLFERTRYGELELSARERQVGERRLQELERLVRARGRPGSR